MLQLDLVRPLFLVEERITFLSRVQKVSANVNVEVFRNFLVGLNYSNSHIKSASPDQFSIDYFDQAHQSVQSNLVDNAAELYMLFTPNRNIFGYGVERKPGANLYPTFLLSFQKGLEIGAGPATIIQSFCSPTTSP